MRRAYLPQLAQAGRLGQLIVRQAELYARSEHYEQRYDETCSELLRDIINFQHDPLACAISLGWRVEIEQVPLKLEVRDNWLYEIPDRSELPMRIVTKINGSAFNEFWCDIVCG